MTKACDKTACEACDICPRKAPLFAGLPPEDEKTLHSFIRQLRFRPGETISQEGETAYGLYIVRRGTVKLSKLQFDGKEQVLAFLKYGDAFGERSLLLDEPLSVTAQAVDNVTVCLLPKTGLKSFLEERPSLSLRLSGAIASRVEDFTNVIGLLGLRDSRDRITAYLTHLAQTVGQKTPEGVEITLPATRVEVGRMLGITPENFSRRLRDLKEEGLVETKTRRVILLTSNFLELNRGQ